MEAKIVSGGERNGMAKLTWEIVREIRRAYAAKEANQVQLGRKYGVSDAHICGIVSGRFWKEAEVSTLRSECDFQTTEAVLGLF